MLAFREALQNPKVDPRPLGQELYNILIKPIEKQLEGAQAKTLVWSLDGTLRYLPFAALFDGKQYLAEKYQQVIITLASRTRLSEPVNHNWRGLGLGVSQAGAVSAPGSNRRMGFKALPEVPAELSAIIRDENLSAESTTAGGGIGVLPGKRLLDKEFTARSFADALGRSYSLIHIASHFSFLPGNADQSFLLLGDGTALTLESVRTSDDFDFKGVELLTLSACNTGVGTTGADGKEVEGFGAVAQERGAKAVLATLWPVADESTRKLMTRFYRNYGTTTNVSKAEALRQAQISLLRGEDGGGPASGDRRSSELAGEVGKPELPPYKPDPHAPFSHPFYWAPFILIGNWR
ncbi:MAG: CHAT domain-containing protein [Pyrinomonadaceae bacterium]